MVGETNLIVNRLAHIGLNTRSFTQLCLAVLAASILAGPCPVRGAEDFRLVPRPIEIPERGIVRGYNLLVPGTRFFFLPPEGWKIRTDSEEKKINLTTADLAVLISVKVHAKDLTNLIGSTLEERRIKVLEKFTGGRITNEFTAYSSGGQGPAYDVTGFALNKKNMAARVAFIPYPGGTIEFTLQTSFERFAANTFAFGNLLTSFKSEPRRPSEENK